MYDEEPVKFFFNPFRSKIMLALISIHVLFIFSFQRIFDKAFFLAPDERGYLQVAKDVYSANYEYVQWGWPWRSPVWFLQLIYTPFKILIEFGVPDLIAFRINTLAYSSSAIYFVLAVFHFHNSSNKPSQIHKFALLTFCLPTFFLWCSLGLRESFLYLSFSFIGAGIVLLSAKRYRIGFLLLAIGCLFLAYTKDYVYLIFLVSLLITILIKALMKQFQFTRGFLYVIALLVPIVITPSITLSLHGQFKDIVFGDQAPRSNLSGNSTGGEIGAWGTERGLAESCEDNTVIKMLLNLVKPSDKIQTHKNCDGPNQDGNSQEPANGSNSEEKPVLLDGTEIEWETSRAAKLSLEPAHLSDPRELFFQFLKILTLPIPLIDNGSSVLNIVAWESPIWLFLVAFTYFTVIINLKRTRKLSDLNL